MRWRYLAAALALLVGPAAHAADCREYTTTALIGGQQQRLVGTACRQPDGTWRIMSSRPQPADHDRARAAVAAGEALPLSDVLARLRPRYDGRLLDVEMLQAPGAGWQYQLKLMSRDDRVRELTVDALTADVLDVREGR